MMMHNKTTSDLVWNIFRDVTTDTTNKDPRPEDPRRGRGNKVDYRIFWRCVNLFDTTNKSSSSMLIGDTTNKKSLFRAMMMRFYRDPPEIEPIRLKAKIVQPTWNLRLGKHRSDLLG